MNGSLVLVSVISVEISFSGFAQRVEMASQGELMGTGEKSLIKPVDFDFSQKEVDASPRPTAKILPGFIQSQQDLTPYIGILDAFKMAGKSE